MGLNETKRLANKKIKNKLVLRIIKDKTLYMSGCHNLLFI